MIYNNTCRSMYIRVCDLLYEASSAVTYRCSALYASPRARSLRQKQSPRISCKSRFFVAEESKLGTMCPLCLPETGHNNVGGRRHEDYIRHF